MKNEDWADVGDLIDRWSKRFPQELSDNMAWVKTAKEELTNELGESESGSLRLGLLLHPSLINYLEHFYPKIFGSNDNVKSFAEKFSKFSIPEKY